MVVWHRIGGRIKGWNLVSILRGWDIFFGLSFFTIKKKKVLLICPSSKLLKTMFKLTWRLNCCTKIIILNIPSFKTNSQGSWNRINEHKIQNITEYLIQNKKVTEKCQGPVLFTIYYWKNFWKNRVNAIFIFTNKIIISNFSNFFSIAAILFNISKIIKYFLEKKTLKLKTIHVSSPFKT